MPAKRSRRHGSSANGCGNSATRRRSARPNCGRSSGVASRIEVLEGLERSHEGLGTGAREVFALLEQPGETAWRNNVLGIVADFLTVRREYAPLIDLALGERAQRFVVHDLEALTEALRQRGQSFSGRVSFLPVSAAPARPRPSSSDSELALTNLPPSALTATLPGVVAPAERVVRCDDPRLSDLPARLLGRTLIVRDLATARTLAGPAGGFRCVTLLGELVEADGTLTVGTYHPEAGILSRKSELRDLREEVAVLDERLTELEHDLGDLRERLAGLDAAASAQQIEIDVLTEQAADLRSRVGQHKQRRAGLHEEVEVNRSEISGLETEIVNLEKALGAARAQALAAEERVQELQERLADADREIRGLEGERQHRQQEALTARVALAHVEEKLKGLQSRHRQSETDLRRREDERGHEERALAAARARQTDSEAALLHAYALLAAWYPRKEQAERCLAEWTAERARIKTARHRLAEEAHANRETWRTEQEQAHTQELAVNALGHRRDILCVRLQEDYQIDLSALYEKATTDGSLAAQLSASSAVQKPADEEGGASSPISPDEEIEELKKKLARLGSVNMEALQELNELEVRASTLQLQFEDLNSAQKSLQEIIAKINNDSRRLFTETFADIRTHFQELFRKLFGGGMADAVLENEADVLESGIEIVARPPGKELRSISLMSGGEKTLTAVALLMGIFRSKPSPFCILDEVDAALDEANIGRFTSVLREFLDRSQFILITHSKRTMACADVLYGVTMQESGISKRLRGTLRGLARRGASPAGKCGITIRFSEDFRVAQDADGLGDSELVCRANGQQMLVGVLVTIWLCCQGIGAFCGMPLMLQDQNTEAPWVVCIVLAVVGIVSLAIGVTTLLRIVRTAGLEVEVFTDGLAWRQRAQSVVWRWSDVKYVRRHQFAVGNAAKFETLPMRFFYYACANRMVYTLEGNDGAQLTLNGYLENVNELTELIEENTRLIRLPKYIASFKAGKTVRFGDLEVNRDGISKPGEVLPWDDVKEVSRADGWVTVLSHDSKKPWCQFRDSKVPNAHLLVDLVNAVQDSSQKE